MLKKPIGIIVCTLLIVATVSPVAGIVNNKVENQTSVESEPQYGVVSWYDEWPKFHHDPENTGYSTSNAPQTNTIKWSYTTGDWVISSPAVVNGKVYIGSFDENFYCLDADTGQKLWNYPIPGLAGCPPAVYNGKVYLDSDYDYFYCLDADTGDLIWTFYKDYRFSRPAPVVINNKVYFAHSRGGNSPEEHENASLYCLDAETGKTLWKSHDMGWFELTSPAVYDDKVYIGSEDSKLYCFNADTGSIIWDFNTSDEVFSSPAVFDDKVYFGSKDMKFYCLNASTGDEIWVFQASPITCSPAVAYGMIYFGTEDGKFYCLNASNGDEIWDYTAADGGFSGSSPAVADGKVYAASWESGWLLCLDAYTGEFFWSYTSYLWQIMTCPAVAYGNVYIGGGMSNNVYCFGDPSKPPSEPSIDGPKECILDFEHEFTIWSIDPEGDKIRYYVDWGDGTNSGWIGPYQSGMRIKISHIWSETGTFVIRARAKDTYGIKSHWSEHTITVIEAPALEIQLITGGFFKVRTVIKNLGSKDASNVNWSITLDGGFILFGRKTTGNLENIPSGGETSIASNLILGFERIAITVNAMVPAGLSDTREQKGFIFLCFIKVYPSG